MEILAPAGSISALKAAIRGGADAVYLGLGELNARLKSNDFTTDNLSEWVGYAHLFGIKVYVTLNTAVKNEERDRALQLAQIAVRSGADALIVADLGLVKLINGVSDVPIHLSTQAGVQNSYDIKALQGLKIKRVILARETPIDEICEIKKLVQEVEIFVQGAICVSFSGGCLLGSKIYAQSGNRGLCNQACRMTYTAFDDAGKELKKGKLLSPMDLSLGEKVRDLEKLGVDSIKIEGRLKRSQYVYYATRYYRDLLDGNDGKEAFYNLCVSFNRGFTKGYTLNKSAKIINPLTSSHIGVEVGVVKKTVTRNGYKFALVDSSYAFQKGDGAKILRKGIEVGGSDVTSVKRVGKLQEIPVSEEVSAGDRVCLTTNALQATFADRIVNELPIDVLVQGCVGSPITLTVSVGKYSVSVQSDSLAQRSNSEDNAALLQKLSKIGGTDFYIGSMKDEISGPIFLNPSELNAMRRKALAALREKIVSDKSPRYKCFAKKIEYAQPCTEKKQEVLVEVQEITSPDAYPKADIFVIDPTNGDWGALTRFLQAAGDRKCYLRLPKILRESEAERLWGLLQKLPTVGIYADNLYGVAMARALGRNYIAGFGLNVFNDDTASLFRDADHVAASIEHPFAGDLCFAAGKVRLMSFAHCPFSVAYGKSCATCDKSHARMIYRSGDRDYLILRGETIGCDFAMYENEVTFFGKPNGKSLYYRFVGAYPEETRALQAYLEEDIGE